MVINIMETNNKRERLDLKIFCNLFQKYCEYCE